MTIIEEVMLICTCLVGVLLSGCRELHTRPRALFFGDPDLLTCGAAGEAAAAAGDQSAMLGQLGERRRNNVSNTGGGENSMFTSRTSREKSGLPARVCLQLEPKVDPDACDGCDECVRGRCLLLFSHSSVRVRARAPSTSNVTLLSPSLFIFFFCHRVCPSFTPTL